MDNYKEIHMEFAILSKTLTFDANEVRLLDSAIRTVIETSSSELLEIKEILIDLSSVIYPYATMSEVERLSINLDTDDLHCMSIALDTFNLICEAVAYEFTSDQVVNVLNRVTTEYWNLLSFSNFFHVN